MQTIDEFGGPAPKRPTFITVLGILTFVGCGIYLISTIYGIVTFEANKRVLMAMVSGDNQLFGGLFQQILSISEKEMENFFNWSMYNHFAALLNVATCLTGALLMWNLKRIGFYIYAIGAIFPIITGIFLWMSASKIPTLGMTTGFSVVVTILFSIGFVVMYGVNLKYMKHPDKTATL